MLYINGEQIKKLSNKEYYSKIVALVEKKELKEIKDKIKINNDTY